VGVRIRQRKGDPTKSWWLYINWRRQRRARFYGPGKKAKAAAEREAIQVRARIARGDAAELFVKVVPTPAAVSFADLANEALRLYEGLHSLRDSTRRNHRSFLAGHLVPYFGERPVSAVTFSELEIERFIAHERTLVADGTLAVGLPTLKLILRHAVKRGLLPSNPLAGEPLWTREPPEPVKPFPSADLRAILTSAYKVSVVFGAYVQVLAQTGMRPGEGLALRRRDFERMTGMMTVDGTWARGPMGHRGLTKTPSSVRSVSVLHPVAEDGPSWSPRSAGAGTRYVLDALMELAASRPDDDSRLFPFSTQHMARLWARMMKSAQVSYRHPHALRHSWASILLSRRAPLPYLVKAGGWQNATTPLRIYMKWVPGDEPDGSITIGSSNERATETGADARAAGKSVDSSLDWPSTPTGGTSVEGAGGLRAHCREVGRDYDTIQQVVRVGILIGENEREVERLKRADGIRPLTDIQLVGTPAQVTEALLGIIKQGARRLTVNFADAPRPEATWLFASAVLPHL
jgi:integrase